MAVEYAGIAAIMLIGASVSAVIAGASYLVSTKVPDGAKVSVYECGFDPFESARAPFAVKFFLVGVLFIVFDLELSYVFPWAVSCNQVGPMGYWAMVAFLVILTVGFVYEWASAGME